MSHSRHRFVFILALFTLCNVWAASQSDDWRPNPKWQSLSTVRRQIRLVYSGVVIAHLRLGHSEVTREGRQGQLRYEVAYTRELDGPKQFRITDERFYVNGQQLANELPKLGKLGLDPNHLEFKAAYVPALPHLWGLYIQSQSDWKSYGGGYPISTLDGLVDDVRADVSLHKVYRRGPFTYESIVEPHAGATAVQGKQVPYAKMQVIARINGKRVVSQDTAWVNDDVPGRVIRVIGQEYLDDGSPGDSCDISLLSAITD